MFPLYGLHESFIQRQAFKRKGVWLKKAFGISSFTLPSTLLKGQLLMKTRLLFPQGPVGTPNVRAKECLFFHASGNKLTIMKEGTVLLYSSLDSGH